MTDQAMMEYGSDPTPRGVERGRTLTMQTGRRYTVWHGEFRTQSTGELNAVDAEGFSLGAKRIEWAAMRAVREEPK